MLKTSYLQTLVGFNENYKTSDPKTHLTPSNHLRGTNIHTLVQRILGKTFTYNMTYYKLNC